MIGNQFSDYTQIKSRLRFIQPIQHDDPKRTGTQDLLLAVIILTT